MVNTGTDKHNDHIRQLSLQYCLKCGTVFTHEEVCNADEFTARCGVQRSRADDVSGVRAYARGQVRDAV